MLRDWFYQLSMCAADPDVLRLAPDSFERRLREELTTIVSADDFTGWYHPTLGAPSCGPVTMTGMLLLQTRYGLTDGEIVERARRDLGFRYALRMDLPDQQPPSVSKYRGFRARLYAKKGEDFLHQRVLDRAAGEGLVPDTRLQAQDSSNTDCRGAQLDTFNLIGAAIGAVIREVARAADRTAADLAAEWQLARYLARSVKGQVDIDWSSEDERNKLLTEEIADADRLPELVAGLGLGLRPAIDQAIALAKAVARQDVELLDDGTFKIRRGTAKGRIISITDPEARHGHKTSSKTITGFKHHVQATLTSLFVTGITITDAAAHDSAASPELIEQSAAAGVKPDEVVGDQQYGTGKNIRALAAMGVTVLAKMGRTSSKTCIPKDDFRIDLEKMAVTCPQGHTTTEHTWIKDPEGSKERVRSFKFPKAVCQQCPMVQLCNNETRQGGRRSIKFSVYQEEMERKKAFNTTPRAKQVLRSRSAIERIISHLVRMGLRKARFFGQNMVQFQAYLTAAANNLQRIFTLTAPNRM